MANKSQDASHDQKSKSQQQGGKSSGGQMKQDDGKSKGTQGGTHEQHVAAGKQSHKNK